MHSKQLLNHFELIDGIKTYSLAVDPDELLENPELEFFLKVDNGTGEYAGYKRATYKGLRFTITPARKVILSGSIHKFWNGGDHNHDDFSYNDLEASIKLLCDQFNINPYNTPLNGFEFGANVELPFSPEKLLDGLILCKNRCFDAIRKPFYIKTVRFGQYELKLYNKSAQNRLSNDLLRIELVVKKMEFVKHLELKMMSDLFDRSKLIGLANLLSDRFEYLLIIDNVLKSQMRSKDRETYLESQISGYWTDLFSRSHYYYQKRRAVDELLKRYNADSMKRKVATLLSDKLTSLSLTECKSLQELTTSQRDVKYPYSSRIDTLDKYVNSSHIGNEKLCPVTGLDISNQPEDSKYISATSLRVLYQINPDEFQKIQSRYGPFDVSLQLDVLCDRIAHRIRNYVSDQWRSLRRKEDRYSGMQSLFSDELYYSKRASHSISLLQ